MTVDDWLTNAVADAKRRGLDTLEPLLQNLARSTTGLRAADAERRRTEADASSGPRAGAGQS